MKHAELRDIFTEPPAVPVN